LGTYWEPIRNLEGTLWEHIGKQGKMEKKSFTPPKLKRNKSKAPWAFPLAERKINPHPPRPNKTCMESPLSKWTWTVHSPHQIQLEKKNLPSSLPPPPTRAESCSVRDRTDDGRMDDGPDDFRGCFI
jgi:hypothetical protein